MRSLKSQTVLTEIRASSRRLLQFHYALSALRLGHHYVARSFARCDFQFGHLPMFDMALDGCLVRGAQLEIRRPITRPGGRNSDLPAVALHEHELKSLHPGAAVVHIRYPIIVARPEPWESLVPVGSEFLKNRLFCFACQAQ